jgi:CubicO group peptidase (beta-lactamase class C family)
MFIKERITYFEEYLRDLVYDKGVFPGAVFGLVAPEDKYIGFVGEKQKYPNSEAMTQNTIFDLASLTKVIATTSAIMILLEDGKLKMNTKIKDILSGFKYDHLTIEHLMLHTAGYSAEPVYKGCKNKKELMEILYGCTIDEEKFEKKVMYSDIGFLFLGLIIEEITGDFEAFLKERLFKPLRMENTFFNPSKDMVSKIASTEYCTLRNTIVRGEVHDEKAYLFEGVAGHAGLFSTVEDLSNFAMMVLKDGMFEDKQIFSRNTIDLICTPKTKNLNLNRTYGWAMKDSENSVGELASDMAIYHTGFTGTSILIDRYYGKAFILLSNVNHPSRVNNEKLVNRRKLINNIAMTCMR